MTIGIKDKLTRQHSVDEIFIEHIVNHIQRLKTHSTMQVANFFSEKKCYSQMFCLCRQIWLQGKRLDSPARGVLLCYCLIGRKVEVTYHDVNIA